MARETFDTLLRGSLLLNLNGGQAVVGVRGSYAVDWIEHRLAPMILRTLSRRLGRPVEALQVVTLGQP